MEHLEGSKDMIHDLLLLSQNECSKDVSIICHNGVFRTNSFVLASVFPIFRIVQDSSFQQDDDTVILMPDLNKDYLETFFQSLYNQCDVITTDENIRELLKSNLHQSFTSISATNDHGNSNINSEDLGLDPSVLGRIKVECEEGDGIDVDYSWNDYVGHSDPLEIWPPSVSADSYDFSRTRRKKFVTEISKPEVTDDIKYMIICANPDKKVKFIYSQRMVPQMVVDDFILKKKKGPTNKGVINWGCWLSSCRYTAITSPEGQIRDVSLHGWKHLQPHNHPPQPEQVAKREASFKIKQNLVGGLVSVREITSDVVNEANDEGVKLENVGALKQAARRFNKKLRQFKQE